MIKKIFIFSFLILVVVIIGVSFYVSSNLNALVAKYKPELEQTLSSSLKQPVSIGQVDVRVFPRTVLKVDALKIGGQANATEAFTLKNITVRINLFKVFTGNPEVTELLIDSPELVLVKDDQGVYLQGLPRSKPASVPAVAVPVAQPAVAAGAPALPAAPLPMAVNSFQLKDALIKFEDRVSKRTYEAEKLNVQAALTLIGSDLQLTNLAVDSDILGDFPMEVSAQEVNLNLASGAFKINPLDLKILGGRFTSETALNIQTVKGDLKTSSSDFPLTDVRAFLGKVTGKELPLELAGKIDLQNTAALAGAADIRGQGAIKLKDVSVSMKPYVLSAVQGNIPFSYSMKQAVSAASTTKDLGASVNGQPVKLNWDLVFEAPTAQVRSFDLTGFGGTFKVAANLNTTSNMPFTARGGGRSLSLPALASAAGINLAVPIVGTVDDVNFDLSGALTPNLMNSLTGPANVTVSKATIEGINLAAEAIESLKIIPLLSESLKSSVPQKFQAVLNEKNTTLDSIKVAASLNGPVINMNSLAIKSTLFSLTGRGTLKNFAEVNVTVQIAFVPEIATAFVAKVKELQAFVQSDGSLVLPMQIQGTLPNLRVIPDATYIAEKAATAAIKKHGEKLLDSVVKKSGVQGLDKLLKW